MTTTLLDDPIAGRIRRRLEKLYGDAAEDCLREVVALVERFRRQDQSVPEPHAWDERDVVLITYADQVRATEEEHAHVPTPLPAPSPQPTAPSSALPPAPSPQTPAPSLQPPTPSPLSALENFLRKEHWDRLLSTVHLLPFFPYSSDDGFSVIDYLEVDPQVGNWDDIEQLRRHFRLMFDLVLNHISRQSAWFQAYLTGQEPYRRFFMEVDPDTDLSEVVRPRSLPLLTPVQTPAGTRHVWTTFSSDQVDLDYRRPQVLVAMLEILLAYVAHGAQIVRLDAVAFLWKEIGTNCLHLPSTHEVVKLMRDLLEWVAPGVWLLTETNVPHQENIHYFGQGDEARIVYQFSLPPLLLDAFVHHDATALTDWLVHLEPPPPGTTFLNFTASHDGIGVRPLEGLIPAQRIDSLVKAVQLRGGLVSTRRQTDGTDVPYELNIAYVDALAPEYPKDDEKPDAGEAAPERDSAAQVALHARRFLATQAVMLAMRGIPAVYFHSLVGSRNDTAGATASGQPRRINRQKFSIDQLQAQIGQQGSLAQTIYHGYRHLLEVRRQTAAFHPEGRQQAVDPGNPALAAFLRQSPDGSQTVLVAVNVSDREQTLDLAALNASNHRHNLLTGQSIATESGILRLPAGQTVWLE